jgi:hypothetical protein
MAPLDAIHILLYSDLLLRGCLAKFQKRMQNGRVGIRMTTSPLDFDFVREIVLALPDVEEGSGRGAASLKVRGRLLTCPATQRSAESHSLVVRIGFDERAKLIAADPAVYYVTAHYINYPSVLVRLSRIRRDALRELLGMAWRSLNEGTRTKKRGVRKRAASQRTPDSTDRLGR